MAARRSRGEHVIAWVLNLDADVELATGAKGNGYSPSRGVIAAMEEPRARLARALLREGDIVLSDDSRVVGAHGRAFCPTPRAIAIMKRAGVEPEPHPSFDVLRRVNGRAFCASLGQPLEGSLFAERLDEALRVLAMPPPLGRQWRAKRAFGMAGRGQRPIAPGEVREADQRFLATSIERDGGIQIEPEVDIARELAMHGMLAADGDVKLGRLLEQRCDASGQWLESLPLDESTLAAALGEEAERVAHALYAAAYFGPFGIDAYEYRVGSAIRLNPRSEINARYSMGFPASGLV